MKRLVTALAVMASIGTLAGCSDDETVEIEVPGPSEPLQVSFERSMQSSADGAWFGLHDSRNELDYSGYSAGKPLPNGAEPWRNNQYVLGSTTTDSQIWYGASTSVYCYWPMISMKMPVALMNFESERMACQLLAPTGQMPDAQTFVYNPSTGKNTHLGPDTVKNGDQYWEDMMNFRGKEIGIMNPVTDPETGEVTLVPDETRYAFTFRAAGSMDGIVFMMGYVATPDPEVINDGTAPKIGYNRLFAFNEANMEYLGYSEFHYDTVRRFETVTHPDGSKGMYWFGGPDQSGGQAGISKNQMLRWVGTPDAPFTGGSMGNGFDIVSGEDFLKFGVVGDFAPFTDNDGDTRFASSAWYNPKGEAASMLYTNKMPANGFTAEHPVEFKSFFSYDQYDPDTTAAHGAKLAANAFYGDYLYFGSYHQGTSGAYDHLVKEHCKVVGIDPETQQPIEEGPLCAIKNSATKQDDLTIAKHQDFMMKSWRALSLFRIKTADIVNGNAAKVELLYGNEKDWVFVADGKKDYEYHFEMQPNKMGQKPLYGKEGFGHEGLVYTFTMAVHDDKLFVGTWNATAGLYDIFEPLEGWKHEDSHNKVALGDLVLNPNDIAAEMSGMVGAELEAALIEMLMEKDPDMSPEDAAKQAKVLAAILNPIPKDGGMQGEERLYKNNPAYFLYNAVKEQNQNDERAGRGGWMAVFENTDSPATIVDKHGFGNVCNNGIRNAEKINGELYFGTTSWCNLTEDAGLEFYKYTGDNR
ncbi:hypothetical protein [Ferrimonas sp. SCSIO 43195]|uniref:hypothetical protein n=1 Tax=Ferrimonas sp. SCSIO 43195 TaxID=2822844 RepID=UPI002074ED9B|nr:hypothetical protein [Ferrimonas sp. SCSIO 43195]USD37717.1 hypothetical protein J8Z22_00570 [Ferrimonas sp. SCSIO 43195]